MTKRLRQKLRFWLRLATAIWQKHRKLIIFSFVIGIISFWLIPQIIKTIFKDDTQKIGLVGKFTTEQLPLEVQQLVSQGLTTISEDGQAQAQLAESWQVLNDGEEYVFTLKKDLVWHDEKPILAKDINYHFSDVAASPIGDYQIKFILKEPFFPFPSIVSRPVFKKDLIGTGQYQVQKITKNGQIVEKINLIPANNAKLAKIIFRFYPTEQALKTAFKLGEVNIIEQVSSPDAFESWKDLNFKQTIKFNRFAAVFFNTQNPKLADKSIRQGLAYAIRKDWSNRALGPINPNSWAFNANVKKYQYDEAKAKKLIQNEGQALATIELATIPSLFSTAEAIKEDWQAIGVETKIKAINRLEENFEALLIIQEIPSDPDQYQLWHSTQNSNISQYKSFKVDNLLEEGRKTADLAKRKEIYQDFQRFLVEDTPAAFLFHPTLYTISRN